MFKDVAQICASPLRLKVLTFFIRREGEWGGAADVAATLGAQRASVQRELATLARDGILKTRTVKRMTQYAVNEKDALFMPLFALASSALAPSHKDMSAAFKGLRGVTLVVASGLLAKEPKSSIDLLVVSRSPDVKKIEKAIKKIEALSALPLRYSVMEAGEYAERRQAYDRLLRDIFDYKHDIILERVW